MSLPLFNVRVYGIIQKGDLYLLSHEWNDKVDFWKFPGGGVEENEGIEQALKRELMEELKTEVKNARLFYVNEHYQKSLFGKESLLAFYYLVNTADMDLSPKKEIKWGKDYHLRFKWISADELAERLHFPLDKIVANRLTK